MSPEISKRNHHTINATTAGKAIPEIRPKKA
jgi:hypothetical protein